MNHKPFDLKAALSGELVTITGKPDVRYKFTKLLTRVYADTPALEFDSPLGQGRFVSDLNGKSTATDLQLAMAPKKVKKTLYVNLYPSSWSGNGKQTWFSYDDPKTALTAARNYYGGLDESAVALAVPVEIEVEE